VITEAAAVTEDGRISPKDLGIWKDEHIAPLRRITDFIHAQGAIAGVQLAHAGRKASVRAPWEGRGAIAPDEGGWEVSAPSSIPFTEGDPVPHELTKDEIQNLVGSFREAATRAVKAGFRLIELHAAHGYLIHEFLSPLSNRRTDEYGGEFDNRIRFLLEIVGAVNEVWPSAYPLFVRISATEWTDRGWTPEDSVELARRLRKTGVDLIDCSSGGNLTQVNIPVGPLYQVPFAEKLKREAGILTGAVGMITTPAEAEAILTEGRADMIIFARQLLRDPYFPMHAARELAVDLPWPVQYERAR
jgi:2,4-dienoyl-CoA reductase-like NADH-dependent reductase (Old Yellow Enzyme family)